MSRGVVKYRKPPAPADRMPPTNLEAEVAVLGGLLIDNGQWASVEWLKPDDFFRADLELIFRHVSRLLAVGKPVDSVILADSLKKSGQFDKAGGLETIDSLLAQVPHAANTLAYAGMVREKAVMRAAIEAAGEIERQAYLALSPADEIVEAGRIAFEGLCGGLTISKEPPLICGASEVESKPVEWLWPNRVAVGFIALFAGRTGQGKSFVALDLASRLSNGWDFPDECAGGVPMGSLIISEDPHDYVLKPRLEAMGADCSRISFLTWEAMGSYRLSNVNMLDRAWQAAGEPKLLIIDPPTNFLDSQDEHRNSEVRQILMKVIGWLQLRSVACIMISHLNKGGGKGGVDAMSRVIGSVAWGTTCRIASLFVPDPDDESVSLMAAGKSNLGPPASTWRYRITEHELGPVVEWLGRSDLTANEAMNGEGGAKTGRANVAADWLEGQFRRQRVWGSDELAEAAAGERISRSALFEAKKALPIRAVKAGAGWTWEAQPGWPRPTDDEMLQAIDKPAF